MKESKIIIYTDGSAIGNPGPGGCAAVLIYGKNRLELSKGYRLTTNNRMELMAVIMALEALKKDGLNIIIFSDSRYVVEAVEKKWIFKWKSTGFNKKKNIDLWMNFLELYPKNQIQFKWVEAHVGISENEKCDFLAKKAAENPQFIDKEYENLKNRESLNFEK